MKINFLLFAITILLISCSNNEKTTEIPRQESNLKSDVLVESSAIKPFSRANANDLVYLFLSGNSILESTATFMVLNEKGEELHCESFLAKELIQPEYKTANSTLKAVHIREVVEGFFVDDLDFKKIKDDSLARL